jgi:uncharacterized small protein (DUF1192 family)
METGERRYRNGVRWGAPIDVNSPEFVAKVRARIGKPYEHLVDPSVAGNILDPNDVYGLQGINVGFHTDAYDQNKRPTTKEEREHYLGIKGLPTEGLDPKKYIYGVGAGAAPTTFAHEFRHNEVRREGENRLADVRYAPTPESYAMAIQEAYEYFTKSMGSDLPISEKERYVLGVLEHNNKNQIDRHIKINNYEPSAAMDALYHPIDTIMGRRKTGSKGTLAQGTYQERVDEPYLNWVGSPTLPDPLNDDVERVMVKRSKENQELSEEMSAVQAEADRMAAERKRKWDAQSKNKKAAGGAVTMPNNYRAGGRVRVI